MNYFDFKTNWNNKLDCQYFTTLRLSDKKIPGEHIEIKLKGDHHCLAQVVDRKKILLNQINSFIAGIDTGYSVEECKTILKTMYKNKRVNWDTQLICLYLIRRTS
jgi:hypothetical protein